MRMTTVPKMGFCLLLMKILLIQDCTHTAVAQVLISPSEITAYDGGSATYLCITSTSINTETVRGVQWFIDGVQLDNLQHGTEEEFFPNNGNSGRLRFTDVTLDLDMSRISCAAEFESGSTESSSTQSLLRVQGVLSIGSINLTAADSHFYLTWPEPFTLDITGEDPDIVGYCVDVINSTSSVTDCEITNNEFYYTIPSNAPCTEYIFNVSARNAAGTGEPSTTMYRANPVSEVDGVLCISVPSSRDVHSEFVYQLIVNQPVCNTQLMSLRDYYTNNNVTGVTVTPTQENITLSAMGLQFNRRYNATMMVHNSGGSAMVTANISTHPIVNATVITQGGAITLSTEYFRHSNESGALYLFLSLAGDAWALVALNREDSDRHTLPFSLPAGRYRVSVYDIEHNGTVLSGVAYPAYTRNEFTVSGAQDQGQTFQTTFSRLDGCTVTTVQCRIDVACTYSSLSGATGFQVIVQRQNQGDKLYVSQTNRASASVMVEESGMYLVIVLAIEGAAGITGSTTTAEYAETVNVDTQGTTGSNAGVVAAVIVVLFLVILAVAISSLIGLICIYKKYFRQKGRFSTYCVLPTCGCDEAGSDIKRKSYDEQPRCNQQLPVYDQQPQVPSTNVSDHKLHSSAASVHSSSESKDSSLSDCSSDSGPSTDRDSSELSPTTDSSELSPIKDTHVQAYYGNVFVTRSEEDSPPSGGSTCRSVPV